MINASNIKEIIKENNVSYLRLQFCDILGTIKNVEVPISEIDDVLDGKVMFDGSSIMGFVRIEETDMKLVPDLNTFLILEFEGSKFGKVARIICDVYKTNGEVFPGDPRQIIKHQVDKMKEMGYSGFNIGFEPEFYLFKTDEYGEPILSFADHGGYFDLAPIDGADDVRREIVMELEQLKFQIEASHHEVGPGQNEINFKFQDVVAACDALQTFKQVVKTIAKKHGLYATFMAKPIVNQAGNGMHCNCSLTKEGGSNAFYDETDKIQLSNDCYKFIAGVEKYARELTAITNPTVNSYKRLVPGYEAPCYVSWSPSNRSTFIRIPASRGAGTRIEVRSVDPMANPYLATAAILAAGLAGIKEDLTCNDATYTNLFKLTNEERKAMGIKNLPDNLYDAIKELKKSELMKEAIGEHCFENFITAKLKEWENFKVEVHDWELKTYLNRY